MSQTKRPDRVESETVNGKKTKLRFYYADPEYKTRIEIERTESWEFGVDEDAVAHLVNTSTVISDVTAEPSLPEWLSETLYGLGISEVRHA